MSDRPPLRVRVYDKALAFKFPLSNAALSVTPRHQAIGQATITVPPDHERAAALLTPGMRVTVDYFTGTNYADEGVYYWPDAPAGKHWMRLLSGPIWDYDGSSGDDNTAPFLSFTAYDDRQVLGYLTGSPVPAGTLPGTLSSAYDVRSGAFETVVKGYLNANKASLVAGDTQHYAVPLTVATDAGRGPTVKAQSRFDNLDKLLGPLEVTAKMGIRIVQSGTSLIADVYTPTDRTARPLTLASGAVTKYEFHQTGPTLNDAITGDGSGTKTTRVFSETKTGDAGKSWPLIRGFVDASGTTDAATLAQQTQSALDAGGPTSAFAVTVAETDYVKFGKNLNISDLVTVQLVAGLTYTDYVSECTLTYDGENGLVIAPQVGATAAAASPSYKLAKALADARNHIGQLGRA